MTTDEGIRAQISELVAREHELRHQLQAGEIDRDDEQQQLRQIEIQLDQCWDLLRQREALRNAGGDPAKAAVRPPSDVEGYLG